MRQAGQAAGVALMGHADGTQRERRGSRRHCDRHHLPRSCPALSPFVVLFTADCVPVASQLVTAASIVSTIQC